MAKKHKNTKKPPHFTIKDMKYNDKPNMALQSNLIIMLGLQDFIQTFSTYFARKFPQIPTNQNLDNTNTLIYNNHILSNNLKLSHILHIPSVQKLHTLITTLESYPPMQLPSIKFLDNEILELAKNATLSLHILFEFAQMINFFYHFTQQYKDEDSYLCEYCKNFIFPQEILEIIDIFDFTQSLQKDDILHEYIKYTKDTELDSYRHALTIKIKEKQNELYRILGFANLQEYLVDKQVHFVDNDYALLVRAGYSSVISAKVVGRSLHGFFYIVPMSLENLQNQIYALQDKIQARLFLLAKTYSKILQKHLHFLRFINKEYDFLDRAFARLHFARDYDLEFVITQESQKSLICLSHYAHPSLKNPVAITLEFSKRLLMITGVNAGGKTMLLKSILSALFCAKFLIPMKINAQKSFLPFIKNLAIIAQDPQDSKNDISTFSGRIKEFKQFLDTQDLIIGIDEIEIGTDSNEAASLYKVLLDRLLQNKAYIIVTTHHKHLASLMADNPQTQLIAALYDYENSRPTFEFIQGIGKSYAMECAKYYGIPQELIDEAKRLHGSEANRLEKLIEESNYQITQNKQQDLKLQSLIKEQEQKIAELETTKQNLKKQFESQSLELKRHYNEAIKEIKMLAKQSQKNLQTLSQTQDLQGTQHIVSNIHKLLNKAHKNKENTPQMNVVNKHSYNINDWVKHNNKIARIVGKEKDCYVIELQNGLRLKNIAGSDLITSTPPKTTESHYKLQADIQASMKLDLHGFTKEEAIERLQDFLNHAIMARFSEVLIVHGMGSGILKKTIQVFLDNCNYVRGHIQAPPNMGGLGARIVYL